jgi:hypothetical protein
MKCDSTHLNHNSLVSQKKVVTKDCDYNNGGLLFYDTEFYSWFNKILSLLLISKFEGSQGVMKKGPKVKVTLWISLL